MIYLNKKVNSYLILTVNKIIKKLKKYMVCNIFFNNTD